MNVRFTQIVDYWFGIPICFFLSLIHTTKKLFCKSEKVPSRKILFIELSEMGSAFLAYPSINRVVANVDHKEDVYFLIFKSNAESVLLLNVLPDENVLVLDDKTFFTLIKSTLFLLFDLRKKRIDTTVDLELFSRFTAIISYLSGAKTRVGFSNYTEEGLYRGSLLTHAIWYNPFVHISQNFLHLVSSLFLDPGGAPQPKFKIEELPIGDVPILPRFSEKESLKKRIERILKLNTAQYKVVVLNPDPGQLALRGWPIENYAEFITALSSEFENICFIVCGMKSSSSYAQKLASMTSAKYFLDFCGRTKSLMELTELLSIADLFITSDSGPAHLVSLTDTPAIVMFGPESPHRYKPLGRNIRIAYSSLACSPCYTAANHRHSSCSDNVCMQTISTASIIEMARELL